MLIRGRSTRVSQPTGPVEIDWANPLTSGLGFNLCNFLRRDTAGDALITRTANLAQGTTTLGQGLSSAANAAFSAPQNLSGTNVITVAFVFRQANSTGLQVLVEHTANQNTNVGSCLAHTEAGNLEASISNGVGGVGGYNAIRCAAPAVGRTTRIIIQFERIASINKAIRVWYDGVEQATTQTFNGIIGDSFANSTTYFLGRGSSSFFANGVIHDISIWRRYLSDADIGSWTDSPWRVYRPAERRVWLSDVAGGGAATLVIADAAHSQTADSLVLTSATALAIASAAHAQAAENVTLSAGLVVDLTIQDSAHGHSADSPVLVTQSTLVVADASHAHAADSLTLATQSTLAIADASHAHAADSLTLATGLVVDLTIQDSAHAHTSDTPALAAQSFLQILDASHGHTADSLTLTTLSVLSIADSSHGHAADNLTLSTTALTLVASPDYIGRHTARNFSTARHRTRNFSTAT